MNIASICGLSHSLLDGKFCCQSMCMCCVLLVLTSWRPIALQGLSTTSGLVRCKAWVEPVYIWPAEEIDSTHMIQEVAVTLALPASQCQGVTRTLSLKVAFRNQG